jgi:hypothetical protein
MHATKSITFRVPAFVATAVCFAAFMGSLADTNWWRPFFFAFLPVAFFISASMMSKMYRDQSRLRRRMTHLEQQLAMEKQGFKPSNQHDSSEMAHADD